MWDWHPEPEDKAVWKGACRAGQPDGPGEAQWFEHGRPIDRFVGTYRDGKREGAGYYKWNDTVSFEGSYANDVPQGRGTLRIDDVVLTRRMEQGLSGDGRQGRGDRCAAPVVRAGRQAHTESGRPLVSPDL